jgi:hypothetical protein
MPEESSTVSIPPQPECNCRACGAVMEAYYQKGTLNVPGIWYVTCWNGCWMHGFTLNHPMYPTLDLSDYRCKSA